MDIARITSDPSNLAWGHISAAQPSLQLSWLKFTYYHPSRRQMHLFRGTLQRTATCPPPLKKNLPEGDVDPSNEGGWFLMVLGVKDASLERPVWQRTSKHYRRPNIAHGPLDKILGRLPAPSTDVHLLGPHESAPSCDRFSHSCTVHGCIQKQTHRPRHVRHLQHQPASMDGVLAMRPKISITAYLRRHFCE